MRSNGTLFVFYFRRNVAVGRTSATDHSYPFDTQPTVMSAAHASRVQGWHRGATWKLRGTTSATFNSGFSLFRQCHFGLSVWLRPWGAYALLWLPCHMLMFHEWRKSMLFFWQDCFCQLIFCNFIRDLSTNSYKNFHEGWSPIYLSFNKSSKRTSDRVIIIGHITLYDCCHCLKGFGMGKIGIRCM